ncbi:unnamed protein product [Heterobilharzia americana]|nr:unnamed protein product [Heterobilharzia americana]
MYFLLTSHTPISIKQSDDAAKENAATRLLSLEVKLAVESLCEPGDACSIIESLVAELDSFQNSASVLHFSPFSNRVLDSVTEVKRFRFLFHLPSEGTVPGISLAHSLGFNFLEHDGSLGYQVVRRSQIFR